MADIIKNFARKTWEDIVEIFEFRKTTFIIVVIVAFCLGRLF